MSVYAPRTLVQGPLSSAPRTPDAPPTPHPPPTIDSAIAHRLRQACHGLSISAVSRLTGFNRETVRRYLTGQSPSVEFIARLADARGLSADWLLLGRGDGPPLADATSGTNGAIFPSHARGDPAV